LPAFLKLRKQRFFYRECSHSFTAETTSIVDLNGFISKNVKNEIKVKVCETVSESHIAKEMNVSVHTVRRVVNETAESLRIKPLNELSEHMCWDGFKSVASAEASMSFTYCTLFFLISNTLYSISSVLEVRATSNTTDTMQSHYLFYGRE